MDNVQNDDLPEFEVTRDEFDAMFAQGEHVEVDGPPLGMYLVIKRNEIGLFYFAIVSKGRVIMTSELYETKDEVLQVINSMNSRASVSDDSGAPGS